MIKAGELLTQNQEQLAGIIQKRRTDLLIREGYKSLFWRCIAVIVIGYIVFSQVFLITQAHGNGMFPAIKDGDLILGFRLQQEYEQDDVIVYQVNDTLCVGRLIAKEGDVVTIDEAGNLLVNGTTQGGEIMFPTYAKEGITYPYRVPDGCVFVLGDYRTQAEDSRDFGPVTMHHVKGKVITILRRRGI